MSVDKVGADVCGNPAALASALAKIAGPAAAIPNEASERNPAAAQLYIVPTHLADMFSTHPATEKRIAALMAMAPGQAVPQVAEVRRAGPWG